MIKIKYGGGYSPLLFIDRLVVKLIFMPNYCVHGIDRGRNAVNELGTGGLINPSVKPFVVVKLAYSGF